ncbi:MAG TPA: alpha-amylase family protein [Aliidongia sp.]|uniref:alpha-amylase family protein n=1 Tax=Aliidongia sp. TaxID=1914230 RepID=UPI002DDD238F|nr:alpha-amylase family protein [Aliidongia sp.]HEV2677315.1 alpha-amylase family protein [Aliidongia sp.]
MKAAEARRPARNCFLALGLCGMLAAPAARAAGADDPTWNDYQIIMWQPQSPARLDGLARLGLTAGMIHGTRGPLDDKQIARETAPFRALQLHWYVENIATDFYAAYHRWFPDHPVTWQFDEAKRLHREEPTNLQAFVRNPSLSDPVWLDRVATRLKQHVQAFGRPRALFYNLADEAGIGDLAAAWDFDMGPQSLDGMRTWLRQRYGTLDALNLEWGSRFPDWAAVMPMTTDAALQQPDENFAAWGDFKEWMDVAFARAVRVGTDAVHAADPTARSALEGGQIPGWGGYDYSQLASAVDVMEMYDFGNNIEIARSLNPKLTVLHTSLLNDAEEIHTVWHELLLGGRGLILWDEDGAFVGNDGTPSERGRVLGALAADLRSGLAAQLIASTPAADPVAILYSPAGLRTQWLLDRKADGKPWADRKAQIEYEEDNPVRGATRRAAGLLAHLGVSPQWLTPAMIEQGALVSRHLHVLVLPHAITLSSAEAERIRDFAAHGGTVVTDAAPGQFDEHGRRLGHPQLADLTGAGHGALLMSDLAQDAKPGDPLPLVRLRQMLDKAGTPPPFTLTAADGTLAANVDARVFRDPGATIIGLQRDWSDGDSQQTALEFPAPVYVYDLGHPGPPQRTSRIVLALDRVAPTILALLPKPLPALTFQGAKLARQGTTVSFTIGGNDGVGMSRVVHIEALAPDGTIAPPYTTNLVIRRARATWQLPLSSNAAVGDWTIRMVDLLGGRRIERKLAVEGALVAPRRP